MSPKTKAQFEQIRSRSTSAILQAALELFARNGYHKTSISQIAKEAGVSKGLIYNYFDSKEDLLTQLVMGAMSTGEEIMQTYDQTDKSPFERLQIMVESTFSLVQSNLHYWKMIMMLSFQTEALEGFQPLIHEKNHKMQQQMTQLFSEMGVINPEQEARLFGAIMDGVFMHYMHLEKDYPLAEMKDFILKKYRVFRKKKLEIRQD